MAAERVDIFQFLKHVDAGDLEYWNNLTEEEQKSVAFVVANRWMSCTKNQGQIIAVNKLINPLVFPFGTKHKGLLYRLMLIASSGTEKQYRWVGRKKNESKKPTARNIIAEYYQLSDSRAESYLSMFSYEEVVECANALGYDDPSMKKLKNEYN